MVEVHFIHVPWYTCLATRLAKMFLILTLYLLDYDFVFAV